MGKEKSSVNNPNHPGPQFTSSEDIEVWNDMINAVLAADKKCAEIRDTTMSARGASWIFSEATQLSEGTKKAFREYTENIRKML